MALTAAALLGGMAPLLAQPPPPGQPPAGPPPAGQPPAGGGPPGGFPGAPANARAGAAFDAVGYWAALIVQNWRFRMIVPGRGEYRDVPINRAAKAFADAWDPAAEEAAGKQCEAYGAAALMRQPTRLRIGWQDQDTLQVDTDNGMQTRTLHFKDPAEGTQIQPSWQGYSRARWQRWMPPPAFFSGPFDETDNTHPYGGLRVDTDHLLAGLLRKNGVPYSERASMREYWQVHRDEPDGDSWMTIATTVQDPVYLTSPYTYNVVFKRESDGSKWDPTPCSLRN